MTWVHWLGVGISTLIAADGLSYVLIMRSRHRERWMLAWPMSGLWCLWQVCRKQRDAKKGTK